MSQHQSRKQERGKESACAGKQPFKQSFDEKKSASAWVKRKLSCHIRNKLNRKSESQDPHQPWASNIPNFEHNNLLRRTASEPILKLRAKKSAKRRPNPLQLQTSATPAVRAPDSMAVSPSSASVPKGSSSPNIWMNRQDPQTYGTLLVLKDDSVLRTGIENPILCPSYPAAVMHPQLLTPPQVHCVTVPGELPVMSHKPLMKSLSVPFHISHMQTDTYMLTHPIFQQQWPQQTFQMPKKVPAHAGWSVSPVCVSCPQLLTDNCGSNRLRVPHKQYQDWQHKTHHRSLSRIHSSPDFCDRRIHLSALPHLTVVRSPHSYTTGLVWDTGMLKCRGKSVQPDHAGRISHIRLRLQECGLMNQCKCMKGRHATLEEVLSVHSEEHVACHVDLDSNWKMSVRTAVMAVGGVIDLALCVARGDLRNGFAFVTPPGHHASHSPKYGSILFNYVAIAAKQLQEKLKVKKILIVDWDVHHGSGTEEIFYTDPSVLYISLHHYDGTFFHGTGEPAKVGSKRGKGYNVNVAWSGGLNPPMGDAEYLAAFRMVVLPIAHEFSPNVVLVSAGFGAAKSHLADLTGYDVSAKCFGFLTRQLMELAEGRVLLLLEGGYDLKSLCDASQACVSALVGNELEPFSEVEAQRSPCDNAVRSLETVLRIQSLYWSSVRPMLDTVSLFYRKAERRHSAGSEAAVVVGRLAVTAPNPRQQFPNLPTEDDEALQMKTFE